MLSDHHTCYDTAALYVNKLRVAGLLDAPINAHYERIFETGEYV
jgi:hypothetical protein